MEKVKITFRMPDEYLRKLRKLCGQRHLSLGELVEEAILSQETLIQYVPLTMLSRFLRRRFGRNTRTSSFTLGRPYRDALWGVGLQNPTLSLNEVLKTVMFVAFFYHLYEEEYRQFLTTRGKYA